MTKDWNDLAEIENIQSQPQSLIIFDGNNLAYRFLKRKNYNDFSEDYINTIASLSKSYNAIKTMVCFDFGKSYYRLELLKKYKGNRTEPDTEEEKEQYQEFFNCLNSLPELMPYDSVKYRGVEADDTITFLVENLKDRYEHIWMISSDTDLHQLIDTNVSAFSIFSRREVTIDSLYETKGLTPLEYMYVKIIMGDTSDNISGVSGIGEKRASTLIKKYGSLDNLIDNLPIKGSSQYITNLNLSADILKRNETLINLKRYNKKAITSSHGGDDTLYQLQELLGSLT
tara:strand:- start:2753 stop:3607 length:855 start_codon:yes stop_codon:yes gene_type:complete